MNQGDERKFLHDLANPLAVAVLAIEAMMDYHAETSTVANESTLLLKQVSEALGLMATRLQTRRELLIQRGVPSGQR